MHTHGKGREWPRLSAAKLGEYTEATPTRRERIVRDAKFPAPFITARYVEAIMAVRRCFLAGGDVAGALRVDAARIAALPGATRTERTAHESSARAVRALSRKVEALSLNGVTAIPLGRPSVTFGIEGVTVSVSPQVLLRRLAKKDGSTQYGALLVVMRKSDELRPRSGLAVAELLRRALAVMALEQDGTIDPKLCIVVDVFHPGIFRAAVRGGRRIARDVDCACREIAARWPDIDRAA